MDVDIVTIFPGMFQALSGYGVVGRAVERGQVRMRTWNPREYTTDRYRRIDDRPYGGGPGMVMMAAPLAAAIDAARAAQSGAGKVLYLTPQGRCLDHAGVCELAQRRAIVLLCGRYEGIDERLIETRVDEEWSIGDFVLSGGEIAALALIDAVVRQVPGVLGNAESVVAESFVDGLLDHAHYTRPESFEGREVPGVMLSGDHAAVRRWRLKQSLGRTWLRRPDLIEKAGLDEEQRALLDEFRREYREQREMQ